MNLPSWMKTLGTAVALTAATAAPAQAQQSQSTGASKTGDQTTQAETFNGDKYYVTDDAPNTGSGSSWDDPATLRNALDQATENDSVLVQRGSYDTGGEPFELDGEHVLGGIQDPGSRRIDDAYTPDGSPTTLQSTTSRVIEMNGGSLTNIEITGGEATGDAMDGVGGGILVTSGDNDVHRAMIHSNEAQTGAAVYVDDEADSFDLTSSKITSNTSTHGGAITLDDAIQGTLASNTIADNTTSDPGYFTFTSKQGTAESVLGFNADNITITENALHRVGTADVGIAAAAITGDVLEEGQPLETTIQASYDNISKATTTSNPDGSFALPLIHGERNLEVGFQSNEHVATTDTIAYDGATTVTINAERIAHDLTTTTSGLTGGETGELTVSDEDETLFTVFTDNETSLYSITTEDDTLTATFEANGHKHVSTTKTLDGDEDQSLSIQAQPWLYETTVVSDNADSIKATHDNHTIYQAPMPANDTVSFTTSIEDDILPGEQYTVTATATNSEPATKALVADTTDTATTISLEPTPTNDDVTATYTGDVTGEDASLDNATVEIRNADADTLITTTQTDTNGGYEAQHTYPENQPYQAQLIANTDEHRADTTTVQTTGNGNTYTEDFNLERLVHDLTIQTTDATTTNPVATTGAITTASDTLTTYTTGDDGETTTTIQTPADQITITADNDNYNNTTTTQSLGSNKAITTALDLTPIQYEFTTVVENTDGNPVTNTDLTLEDRDGDQITANTGADNQATLTGTINDGFQANENGELTANKDTYQADTLNITFNPDNPEQTKTATLKPETTESPMTITVNSKIIANDLYDGGYDDTPDDITITTPDTTINADFQNQAATFTINDTTSIDDITITHDDTTAFLDETSIYKTSEQNPIDLTLDTGDFDEFPREPHAQSNYGDNASTDDRTITLDANSLVTSYELRFIPRTTPEGNNTVDDYIPHINQGRSKRFTNQTVGDTTYTQDKLFIVEHTENNWLDKASTAYDDVRDTLPFPTSQPDTVEFSDVQDAFDERGGYNLTYIEEGSNGNAIQDGPRFIEYSWANTSASTTQGTFTSEAYSSFNGYEDTAGDEDINDTIFDDQGNFIKSEAAFPMRIQYSSFSDNDNF